MKYAAYHDNLITRTLAAAETFADGVRVVNMQPFVLEGGSLESDGKGTLLTTSECLESLNRNEYLNREQLEIHLKDIFGLDRVLWLENGYLSGDDTDSHIDTLARFCDPETIAYVHAIAFDVREKGRPKREGNPITGKIMLDKNDRQIFIPGTLTTDRKSVV